MKTVASAAQQGNSEELRRAFTTSSGRNSGNIFLRFFTIPKWLLVSICYNLTINYSAKKSRLWHQLAEYPMSIFPSAHNHKGTNNLVSEGLRLKKANSLKRKPQPNSLALYWIKIASKTIVPMKQQPNSHYSDAILLSIHQLPGFTERALLCFHSNESVEPA